MPNLYSHKRKAIAMIELIFSIVIMGIVMLSAPMMISTSTKSSTIAFQQESIAMIASHANSIMTYAWDEENTPGKLATQTIIGTDSAVAALTDRTTVANRSRNLHALIDINASAPLDFGLNKDSDKNGTKDETNSADKDDIDDFHGDVIGLTSIYSLSTNNIPSNTGEYMDVNISIDTNVSYIPDDTTTTGYGNCRDNKTCKYSFDPSVVTAAIGSTNIKLITTRLSTSTLGLQDKSIILHSFMCNIGSFTLDTGKF